MHIYNMLRNTDIQTIEIIFEHSGEVVEIDEADYTIEEGGTMLSLTLENIENFATKLGNTPGITTKQMMALGGWSQPNVAMQYVETNEEQLDELVGRATL